MASSSQLFVLLFLFAGMLTIRADDQEPETAVLANEDYPTMMKRFYAWEDAKRSFDSVYGPKEMGEKRKQFYPWAGKRSDGQMDKMDKRKQFYAWAGRK